MRNEIRYEHQNTRRAMIVDNKRGRFKHRRNVLLTYMGLIIGLGNVWRFPALALANGGGVFFMAYTILLFIVGVPLCFMEMSLGQYAGHSVIKTFSLCPASKGIGISMSIMSVLIALSYQHLIALVFYYIFASMKKTLPWSKCKEEWKPYCFVRGFDTLIPCSNETVINKTRCWCSGNKNYDFDLSNPNCNMTIPDTSTYDEILRLSRQCKYLILCQNVKLSAGHYYFYREVMQLHTVRGISNIGEPQWYLVICLTISWVVVAACLIKGLASLSKMMYATTVMPLVLFIALMIRSVVTAGSKKGLLFLFVPKWRNLLNAKLWLSAGNQLFFSLSVGSGSVITLGSFIPYKSDTLMYSIILCMADFLTSIIASILVFSTLGWLSYKTNTDIAEFDLGGYGMGFMVFPEALSRLELPQLWSIAFFLMCFLLGIGSQLATVESLSTTIVDQFPSLREYKFHITFGVVVACCVAAIPLTAPGGHFILSFLDFFGNSYLSYILTILEMITVAYIYGGHRFIKKVAAMQGYVPQPKYFWVLMWFTSPLFLMVIFCYNFSSNPVIRYSDKRPYEVWAIVLGWIMFALEIAPIPIVFCLTVYKASGNTVIQKLKVAISPSYDWKPQNCDPSADLKYRRRMTDAPNVLSNIPQSFYEQLGSSGRDFGVRESIADAGAEMNIIQDRFKLSISKKPSELKSPDNSETALSDSEQPKVLKPEDSDLELNKNLTADQMNEKVCMELSSAILAKTASSSSRRKSLKKIGTDDSPHDHHITSYDSKSIHENKHVNNLSNDNERKTSTKGQRKSLKDSEISLGIQSSHRRRHRRSKPDSEKLQKSTDSFSKHKHHRTNSSKINKPPD